MKTKVLITILVLLSLTLSSSAQVKDKRFGFELSTGVSFATSKIENTTLKPGFGFEGIFHYRIIPFTGVYAGWGWNRFAAEDSFAGSDMCFEETGYVFGLQFKHPFGDSKTSYYFRAGGLYNHVEIENSEGEITYDTGHDFGWQLAGGVDVDLGKNWSLTPGIKFNSLKNEVENEGASVPIDLDYVMIRIGILKKF